MLSVYKSEPMNYFILERHYPLYLFVERMVTKNKDVQVVLEEKLRLQNLV